MAASKFFVTVCASLSWALMGPAIEKARAAQVAAMMVRIFMGFLPLPIGWSSFFIVPPGPAGLLIIVSGIGAKHAVALWLLQGACVSVRGSPLATSIQPQADPF